MNNAYDYLAQFYDELMGINYKDWAKYIISFLNDSKKDILDLGCGTAKLSNELHNQNYNITAVDSSKAMLNIAWNNFGNTFPIINQDATKLDLGKKFDAVISTCDVINYILEDDSLLRIFENVRKHLLQKGKFIFDISSKYKLTKLNGNNTFFEDRENVTYIWDNNIENNILEMDITLFKYDCSLDCYNRFDETHKQRVWEVSEVISHLRSSGFVVEGVYEFFTKDAPTDLTERILIVAGSN
ncbi:MAG: class I SAM-dependent DNA methyltransferase [Clostridia bacterium]